MNFIKQNDINIVLIEAQAEVRELIQITLEFDGYDIHEASDVQTGLDMVYAIKPDLILLAIKFPATTPDIRDGLDICRLLKINEQYASIPIILLAEWGQLADIETGLAIGVEAYLIKPFSLIRLIELVKSFVLKEHGYDQPQSDDNVSRR
jgi:DNA-binding response OmpR family regulator